ncbi:DUF1800 family protein [Prosthecobacter sp.]|uniref:DUF1800 family protein n=1 Tax=Prosthecobacter sp. TaxID=1965333 RepID=UPI002AB97721|nr:DUF1800 family protein [Prosthecobacter sp.]MDZ4404480.1 DUF1800 family protein [Prosthecobacter sp.]
MPIHHFRILTFLLMLFSLETLVSATSVTDQNKWPAGQVPVGETNGPDDLDDIWQEQFNAWAIDPAGDTDNDGFINSLEAVAGTNPFVATDSFKIGNMIIVGNAVVFTTKIEAGKKYRVLSSDAPNGPVWAAETLQTPVSGTTEYIPSTDQTAATISIQTPGDTKKFYKLETSDVSSSGDGVSDWVKRKLGLVPGDTDSNDDGVSDVAEITQVLQTPDVVTVEAETAFASEDGGPAGLLRLRRNQSLMGAWVYYTLSGSATAGTDFTGLSGSVYFAPGAKTATIAISPGIDSALEGGESVIVTLNGGMSGTSTPLVIDQTKKQAAVIISNTTAPSGMGLLARYYDHSSGTYAHAANFGDAGTYVYTRSGTSPNYTGTIVIPYTKTPAVQVGHVVRVTFTGGNLNSATYNNLDYTITAVTPGTNFTLSVSGAGLPTNSSSTCNFSIQSFPHPAVIERVDPTVDYEWMGGTPNGVGVVAAAGTTATNVPDNYSDTFEMYLSPATAGSYRFQLDADDKARVLLDLDRNGTFDLPGEEILEHGWDGAATPETIGTFKISASYSLVVPATPTERYKMRVEHVETTSEARCRLQWSRDGGTFANIPQAEQFTHTQAMTYAFTRSASPVTTGTATITLTAHGLSVGNQVALAFTNGTLFNPNTIDPNGYSGTYSVVTVPSADTFTVTLNSTGSTLPANQSAGATGFLENRSTSTTTGVYNKTYTNTTFSNTPGRIGTNTAVTESNNGLWGTGTPDWNLINADTFTVRWSGQVQPQFSEEYTFVVQADDGCTLKINGAVQDLKMLPAANSGGSTYSYDATTGNTIVTYTNSILKLGNIVVGESVRLDPSTGNLVLANGSTYAYDGVTGDAVINYSNLTNVTPGGFAVGDSVEVDPTSGSVNLGQLPYEITAATSTTFTVNFGAGLFSSGSGSINVSDNLNRVVTAVTPTSFTVNFGAGEYVTGTGSMNFDFVNKSLKDWSSNGNERFVRLPMLGGVRYDIELDYWESGGFSRCRLYWFSPSQPKQIIPSERLYPASTAPAPAAPTIETDTVALVGGAFSHLIKGTNGSSVSVSGLPDWLTYNGGVLSGTPPPGSAGLYQIMLTLTNAAGTSHSLINLRVEEAAGTIVREHWNGISGTSVAAIPTSTAPTGTTNLTSLTAPTDFGDDYGARIHGYITAPLTGNYYFWIAASNAAELWISNDTEPVNSVKRAWVSTGTAAQEWNNAGETHQKSPWLALEAGKRYYLEVLHKAGTGAGDNLAVGWLKPGQTGNTPSEIVPGTVLSPYVAPPPGSTPGTLYVASMLSQNGAATNGVGTSTLRLSEDENTAIVNFSYSGLTGDLTDWHVHVDPYLTHASAIVYDGVEPVNPNDGPQPDGSHHWTIEAVGTLSKADIIEIIKQGKAYINLHTALYPAGEIRGNYTLANGSRTFTPPPASPAWTDDHDTNAGAVRFLTQATFGANITDIQALKALASYEAWIDDQFTKAASIQLPEVLARELSDGGGGGQFDETLTFNAWWRNSITGADQLRQRIAFALSEILVVSAQGPLDNRAEAISYYYDRLATNAFGNFRVILEDMTLTPTMGRYLDMLRNDKPDLTVGRIPNENYAREIKQLFSVGLFRMWPDGTLVLNSKDSPIDTYTQQEIVGFAHVFTGWDYGYDGAFRTSIGAATNWIRQMREVPARHFTGPKRLLNNEVLTGLTTAGGQPLDPYATHNSTHYNDPAYQNLPAQELDVAHDQLFNHPNVGPFICRQLIQRLVTSHPSRDYLYRVVQKFNDNGAGVRGDMQAVIKAILLDFEARSSAESTKPAFGKQREPVMRVANAARAFRLNGASGTYSQTGSHVIAVTMANKLAGGNTVYLSFPRTVEPFQAGDTTPNSDTYTVLSTPAPTSSLFYVNAKGWVGISTSNGTTNAGISGTYSVAANSTTATITLSSHWLPAGGSAWLDFELPAGTAITDGVYTAVTSTSTTGGGTTFTITVPTDGAARSGRVRMAGFRGSYTVSNSGLASPNDKLITFDTTDWITGGVADHHLEVGDTVFQNFTVGNPQPTDGVFTVESVPDSNTFTVLTSAAIATQGGANDADNGMWMFPLVSQPLTRSGSVGSLPSTFNMGNTTTDLEQTPLNSPTVFNFFVPDYKYPGALASQGISTPEFQITAETTAVRQANFLYNGLFNPGNTNGISSFKTGTNALVLDFSPWMGAAPIADLGLGVPALTSVPWTHNQNLATLIDQMSTLLMAGQLSTEAKDLIKNFVATPITSISPGTPATNPCVVVTTVDHKLNTGDTVLISGVTTGTFSPAGTFNSATVARTVTVTGARTFTVTGVTCSSASTPVGLTNAHVSAVQYNQGSTTPSDTQKRDRLRAIIHLILTSPDYTIQR